MTLSGIPSCGFLSGTLSGVFASATVIGAICCPSRGISSVNGIRVSWNGTLTRETWSGIPSGVIYCPSAIGAILTASLTCGIWSASRETWSVTRSDASPSEI